MFVHDNACWACPILSSENNEATCRDGVLRFKQGHWHDGLQLANGTVRLVDWLPRGAGGATTSHFVVQPTALSGPFVRNSTHFYQCPQESWCEVHIESGAVACAKGRGSVLCASCLPDHYRGLGGSCRACSEGSLDAKGFVMFFGIYLVLPLCLWLWFRMLVRRSEVVRILVSRVISLSFGKLKIVAGFYTVVVLFESVYALPFPSVYLRFVSLFRVLDFFPALGMLKLNCVVSYSFYSVMHLSCSITFCLMLVIVANSFVALLPSTATLVIFFILTMVYPSVSTIAFRTFNCRSVDGVSYLREDYSKECDSDSHVQAEQFASASIALVSVGLIVVYAALLWPHRAMLRTGATVASSGDRKRLAELSFHYSDFRGPMFFWEGVDSTRILRLTGVVVFMQEGSLFRPVWGMVICLGYFVLLLKVSDRTVKLIYNF
jgi:hypothetical protein